VFGDLPDMPPTYTLELDDTLMPFSAETDMPLIVVVSEGQPTIAPTEAPETLSVSVFILATSTLTFLITADFVAPKDQCKRDPRRQDKVP
jgi:hypothetical protein